MHRRKAYRSDCQHEKNDICIHLHISSRLLPRRTDRSTDSDEKNVPHRASDDCKQQKFRHLHPCHPGGDGNEASDDGNAPTEQNGPLAFLLKPCNRFPGILLVKSEKLHRAAVEQFTKALRADKRSSSIENLPWMTAQRPPDADGCMSSENRRTSESPRRGSAERHFPQQSESGRRHIQSG